LRSEATSLFDVRRSSFICHQRVDSSLKYVEWAKGGVLQRSLTSFSRLERDIRRRGAFSLVLGFKYISPA